MTIDRKTLVSYHDPILSSFEYTSPLSVGNGELAFSVDPTGMQTFAEEYEKHGVPLCTMSQKVFHSTPADDGVFYTEKDLVKTEYMYGNRTVHYAVKKEPGNEAVYDWLRKNPHRANLAEIGLLFDKKKLVPEDITDIHQQLFLYDGIIESSLSIKGNRCFVKTAVLHDTDEICLQTDTSLFPKLQIAFRFQYASPSISGRCETSPPHANNEVRIVSFNTNEIIISHIQDRETAWCRIRSDKKLVALLTQEELTVQLADKTQCLCIAFSTEPLESEKKPIEAKSLFESVSFWQHKFWEECGAVYLRKSTDSRAVELERRIILSLYMLAVHCCGSNPPQETGLFCNSWYGKFHLEMHPLHTACFAYWNMPALLEKSFGWYKKHLEDAKRIAAENGWKGARWPKMTSDNAINSPSEIAVLLIWQQPHILFMLESVYRQNHSAQFLEEYWEIVKETADFMSDFAVYDEKNGRYNLVPPLIPVQEEFQPETVKNPAFETSYWSFGLEIAVKWAERLSVPVPSAWNDVRTKMALPPVSDGFYIPHENSGSDFSSFAKDHPSMLFNYSYFRGKNIDESIMRKTLEKVFSVWNYESLWGWDFAAAAMTAVRLKMPEKAIELLLKDSPKNFFEKNGNNFQKTRSDLPAYFPGNGTLLLAVAMMTAGFADCTEELPGFPNNGKWHVEYENISPLF